MTLDGAVARAVHQSHLVERALHSRDDWFIQIGGLRLPVTRHLSSDQITFEAEVPAGYLSLGVAATMSLFEGKVERSVRPFHHPGEGGFWVSWKFRLPTLESVPG